MGKFSEMLKKVRGDSPDAPDVGVVDDSSATEEIRPRLRGTRNRTQRIADEARSAELERDLDKLFTPEQWAAISTLYFDARYVQTGDEAFRLESKDEILLGASLAASARLLLKIDPGYIAMIIFISNMGKLITMKEMAYASKKRARRPVTPARPADGVKVS